MTYEEELAAEAIQPPGATHRTEQFGHIVWLRKVEWDHLNQVSEEWQNLSRMDFWDQGKWKPYGPGFRGVNLTKVEHAHT